MNDPNKAIDVNLSSFLSLKAELLRKTSEVNKAKATRATIDEHIAKNTTLPNNSQKHQTEQNENSFASKKETKNNENEVDSELLAKSQRILEQKAKFYDRMTRTGGKLNSDSNCLVQFNRKFQIERPPSSESESDGEEPTKAQSDSEEDWVEYTDCLGRTRKCLRIDLEVMKKRDADFAASMPERLDQNKANWLIDTSKISTPAETNDASSIVGPLPTESLCSEQLTVISKQDEQRATWEQKELENLDKEDVHYQDVFFDEARQHGVGYYAFSTDAEERRKQQHDLEAARQQTIEEQEHRDALRAQREKIIAERVLAAKNRQRARQGLPPITQSELDAERGKQTEMEQLESKEARKERKKQEKAKRKQQEEEEAREMERQQHIRPWDKKKLGPNKDPSTDKEDIWVYKPERLPMSQEEWNEKQRAERKQEFAPPTEELQKRTNFSSFPNTTIPDKANNDFVTYQSTKNVRKFQKRNYDTSETPSPIVNKMRGAMIPPPPNLDENTTFKTKRTKSVAELESSVEAGLRFLRDSCDKEGLTSKGTWSAKADY